MGEGLKGQEEAREEKLRANGIARWRAEDTQRGGDEE